MILTIAEGTTGHYVDEDGLVYTRSEAFWLPTGQLEEVTEEQLEAIAEERERRAAEFAEERERRAADYEEVQRCARELAKIVLSGGASIERLSKPFAEVLILRVPESAELRQLIEGLDR